MTVQKSESHVRKSYFSNVTSHRKLLLLIQTCGNTQFTEPTKHWTPFPVAAVKFLHDFLDSSHVPFKKGQEWHHNFSPAHFP